MPLTGLEHSCIFLFVVATIMEDYLSINWCHLHTELLLGNNNKCIASFSDYGINYRMQMKKVTSVSLIRRRRILAILLPLGGTKWLRQDLETLTFSYTTKSQAKPRLVTISQRPTANYSSFQPAQVICQSYNVTFEMKFLIVHDLFIWRAIESPLKDKLFSKYRLYIIEVL